MEQIIVNLVFVKATQAMAQQRELDFSEEEIIKMLLHVEDKLWEKALGYVPEYDLPETEEEIEEINWGEILIPNYGFKYFDDFFHNEKEEEY